MSKQRDMLTSEKRRRKESCGIIFAGGNIDRLVQLLVGFIDRAGHVAFVSRLLRL